jgi:putative ABC transport system permease protein
VTIGSSLRFAADALRGHRLRTILSIAGLAVGIAAVIALTALGEGARRYVTREFTALGTNLVIVLPGKIETTGAMPFGGTPRDLTLDDATAIGRLPLIARVAPISMGTETVRLEGRSRSAPVLGTTAEFLQVRQLGMGTGRFLSPGDIEQGGTEVVLGAKVANELCGSESPLGRVVRIGDWRFRVVGVMTSHGRSLGVFDMDDLVIVPVQTGMTMLNRHSLFRVIVEVRSYRDLSAARHDILQLMKTRHRAEDVTAITQDAVLTSFGSILGALTMALAGIASISLAVAGVGIMNVMLVSVTERRAEIGLLKALGAQQSQILRVFLAEAVLLSVAGGLAGMTVGYAAVLAFDQYFPTFPAAPPMWAVAAAATLSIVVGVVFGVWPARRAMRLEPVAALSRR